MDFQRKDLLSGPNGEEWWQKTIPHDELLPLKFSSHLVLLCVEKMVKQCNGWSNGVKSFLKMWFWGSVANTSSVELQITQNSTVLSSEA